MVAKAMVHNPPLLILDEPTAGVDVELRSKLWDSIRTLNKKGVTIILTTHYLKEAEILCDRIAVINKGKFVELKVCEKISDFLKENFVNDLTYFEKKNKMTIDIISDNSLIIPEYIIDIKNKSKKTLDLIKNIENLKNLETQKKEAKVINIKERK